MKKCTGSVNTRDTKLTYKIFIDWDAKKKYQCDLCENHYENLYNLHQHFFDDHKSKNTSIMENDSCKANLKSDLDEVDPLKIGTDVCINNSDKENLNAHVI